MNEQGEAIAFAEISVSSFGDTVSEETKDLLDKIEEVNATIEEQEVFIKDFEPKASRINVRPDGNLELTSVDNTSRLLLTSGGVEVNLNGEAEGESYSRFTSKSAIFGNYEIKRTTYDGGLTFSKLRGM